MVCGSGGERVSQGGVSKVASGGVNFCVVEGSAEHRAPIPGPAAVQPASSPNVEACVVVQHPIILAKRVRLVNLDRTPQCTNTEDGACSILCLFWFLFTPGTGHRGQVDTDTPLGTVSRQRHLML